MGLSLHFTIALIFCWSFVLVLRGFVNIVLGQVAKSSMNFYTSRIGIFRGEVILLQKLIWCIFPVCYPSWDFHVYDPGADYLLYYVLNLNLSICFTSFDRIDLDFLNTLLGRYLPPLNRPITYLYTIVVHMKIVESSRFYLDTMVHGTG